MLDKTGTNRFRCEPKNKIGVGESKSLTPINVKEPPKISNCAIYEGEKGYASAVEGRNVTLRCDISGSEPLNITWTNGRQVWHDNTVTFEPVNRSDTGTYNLTVSNGEECNKAETSYYLDVYYKPENTKISHSSNTLISCLGSLINITCTSNANPPVEKYSLYRNEEWVQENNAGLFKVMLDKTGINRFTCKPENQIGVGKIKSLTSINVTEPPKISNCAIYEGEKGNASAVEGRNVTLRCIISGSEPLNITWTNGQQVWNDNTVTFETVNRSDTGTYNLTVSNGEECNKAETSYYLDVYFPATTWNFTFTITKKNLRTKREAIDLNTIAAILRDIYQEKSYFKDVNVLGFVQGNVIVNFQLIVVGAAADYLQPLKNAVIEKSPKLRGLIIDLNSIQNGLFAPTTSPTTGIKITTLSTEPTTSPTLTDAMIIVIVVVVVVLLIFIIMVIVCYCKKKRQKDKKNCVVEKVVVVTDGARDNDGYSPSQYAHHGPSHIDPAYDSVEVRKGAKNKNDNQTKSGGEGGGPTYAAVDKTKKNKRKKPDEVTYASLADTQPPGGRGGIVLEPLRKGQHTKMPDKYEETTYAKIVGTKKPASGNQNAAGASNNIPLADMHGQGAETESKPSDQTADPAKQNDHKPATNKKEKPPDNQGQPPTKEDSADSLPDLNGRNNTTMTTVSL
ncbi:uncharacterized protein LOC116292008 [Actinia tenebrosa]|uniref:Uncharacterized protein LOC116292008 n=1 Tax=Actinia tenebrosa TaxID=6105 RepID=A0A6P8HGX7_ACTTE|nr:uncharacterized protein LOC116292008 [Actinia tenebrosa]